MTGNPSSSPLSTQSVVTTIRVSELGFLRPQRFVDLDLEEFSVCRDKRLTARYAFDRWGSQWKRHPKFGVTLWTSNPCRRCFRRTCIPREFWEHLGRTIATFGHLEEVLGKAIFALTATVRYGEAEIEGAFERWLPTLERALIDPWRGLIESAGRPIAATPTPRSTISTT